MKAMTIRRALKRRKPVFRKQESHRRGKIARIGYRKPDGYSSPQRRKRRGKVKMPVTGYSSPRSVRGLHASGLKVVMIYNSNDLKKVDKNSIGVISSKVGLKKRLELLKSKVRIANVESDYLQKKADDFLKSRKEARAALMKARDLRAKLKKDDKKDEKKSEKSAEELEVVEGTNKPVRSKKKKKVEAHEHD